MVESNLVNPIKFWSQYNPKGAAIVFEDVMLTWSEFEIRTDELASGLQEIYGIRPGDRVAIFANNCIEWCETVIAILKTGGIVCPLNVRLVAREIEYIVKHSGTRLIICDKAHRERADALKTADDAVRVVEIGTAEFESLRIKNAHPTLADIGRDTPALLCYTSGTTGTAKGVTLSHGNIWEGVIGMGMLLDFNSLTRTLFPVPLAYSAGVNGAFFSTYTHGGTLYILNEFDPKRCLELMVREGINYFGGAVVMFEMLMAQPEWKEADLSHLTNACIGAAVVPISLLKAWQKKGVDIRQAYGLTEAVTGCAYCPRWAAMDKPHSSGILAPSLRVRIVDDEGQDCPANAEGEILLAGPSVMQGYWNDPESTKETIVDGWLHTGDIGVLDEDGFLAIVDRKKDMIISGGINTYPAEIEKVIYEIQGVVEVAVIGVADEKWGETVAALIRTDRNVSIREVIEHCRKNMADFKVPRYIVFLEEPMPRTMSGKLQKNILRNQYADLPMSMEKVR